MKVTFLGFVRGRGEKIGVGRTGRGSGNIYFFREEHLVSNNSDGLDFSFIELETGTKLEIDEYFLEIPEKEFPKLANMIFYK